MTVAGLRTRPTVAAWILLAAVLVVLVPPMWPLVVVDGDDAAVASSTLQLSRVGHDEHHLLYVYDFQPGTYALLIGMHRWGGIEPLRGFWALTLLGFALFLTSASWFVARLAEIPGPVAALTLLLFQEVYASAYFDNPSILAGGVLFGALTLALSPRTIAAAGAGAVFAAAVWLRADVALVGAAFPVLLWERNRRALWRLAAFGGGLLAVLGLLLPASGVSWLDGRLERLHGMHLEQEANPHLTLVAYVTVFTGVVVLLGAVGVLGEIRARKARRIVVCLAGSLPLFVAYGAAVTTPRYFLYSIPLVAVLVGLGLRVVVARRSIAVGVAAAALFVAQYLLDPCAVLGCVTHEWTYEGPRSVGSIVRLPRIWAGVKSVYRQNEGASEPILGSYLRESDPLVVTWSYPEQEYIKWLLLRNGYRCVDGLDLGGGYLRDFALPDAPDRRVSVLSFFEGSENPPLDPALRKRLRLDERSSLLYLGWPRERPRLYDVDPPAVMLSERPIFRILPATAPPAWPDGASAGPRPEAR